MTMASRYIFILLPALALANIHIEVEGDLSGQENDMKVLYSGYDSSVISDTERKSFQLHEENIKRGARNYFGGNPTDVYLRSPTPWGDLYTTYGWKEVTRTLRPRKARIINISAQPQIVMQQVFENNSSKPATFNVGISQTVQNTVSSSWSASEALTVGQQISYNFDLGFMKAGGVTSISYTATFGRNSAKSDSVTVGATSAVNVMLQPGQSVISQLQATRGSMKVEVEYEASLSGLVAANYDDAFKGHHFWSLPVENVMRHADLSNSLISKEVIEVGFFTNANIVVYDNKVGTKMLERPL